MSFPRKIINDVGHFDETLSPHYAYFEDNDYHYRMKLKGYDIKSVDGCKVMHENSGTMKKYTPIELKWHHQKFREAQFRYVIKWGGMPGEEKYITPFGEENVTGENNAG
jgi:GT2 family glycosyltransferase